MKKKIAILMACTMAAAVLFSGCGSEETVSQEVIGEETGEEEDEVITAEEMLKSTDYDVTEMVTLPADYMDMQIELSSNYEVTDEEIQEYIESYILTYYPSYVETDKTVVEDGDMVDIDFVGTMDGEEFDGGSAENYELTIGSGTFIDGFEDGLIGQEVGTTVDLELTFPEDYSSEDLAGQDVVFTVTINAIVEPTTITYDEITDEYVDSNFGIYGMTTVDDLMADVEETLESMNESSETTEIQNSVLQKLEEESTFDYPEEMLDERYDSYIEQVKEAGESYGMDYEEYVLTYSGYEDLETFEAEARLALESYLLEELALEAIVAEQQISITRSEFEAFVDMYVAYYGFEDAEEFYDYYGGEEYVMLSYAENRALNNVVDAATIIMPDGESESGAEQEEEAEEAKEVVEEKEAEEIEDAEEALEEEPLAEDNE